MSLPQLADDGVNLPITTLDDIIKPSSFLGDNTDLYVMGKKLHTIRNLFRQASGIMRQASTNDEKECNAENESYYNKEIKKIALIVVVDAEVKPLMEKCKFQINENLTKQFLNLGTVSSGKMKDLHIDIVKVATSRLFNRHYSGYTQSAALAALVSSVIKPDLVISFGTAGGLLSSNNQMKIGSVILGEGCLFLDRLRTKDKNAFNWGVFGGFSLKTNKMSKDLNLIRGVVGSQIGYMINKFQEELIKNANIIALDMECAPVAQILNQTNIPLLVLKVISNGVYFDNPSKMEEEYHQNREKVSKTATELLIKVVGYLNGKKMNQL